MEVHFVCGKDEEDIRTKIHLDIVEDRFDRNKDVIALTIAEAIDLRDKLDAVLAGPDD